MQWLVVVSCLLVLVSGPGGGFGASSDQSPSEFCPLNQGVICSDGKHCCPEGRRCSADGRSCIKTGLVLCNETLACPDDYTCCQTITGAWGCCPLKEAVCCTDHKHCCPSGCTCNLILQKCDCISGYVPMRLAVLPFVMEAVVTESTAVRTRAPTKEDSGDRVEGVTSCDDHTSCPPSATCCLMASGQGWGCCPLPQAVCCPDRKHCCPAHYRCDEQNASCVRGDVVMPWYAKLPASTVKSGPAVQTGAAAVRCDGMSQCPTHTTCCRMMSEGWGCCPLQEAVCCPDQLHCCPQGFTCDPTSQACHKVQPLPLTLLSVPDRKPLLRYIKCDDETSCFDGQTCCRTSATTWGCCPYPNAVCCSDMQHCCPTGYTCTESKCILNTSRLNWSNWSNWPNLPKEEV